MPVPDFTEKFNTSLPKDSEAQFQRWLEKNNKHSDLFDYDLRGAWQAGVTGGDGHLPDTYKKPNHPTFSSESQYNSQMTPGGQWEKSKDGKWTYKPSPLNLQMYGPDGLQEYFQRVEPDSTLLMQQ